MPTLADFSTGLGCLESFDPSAFTGTTEVPQDVCNFVLTLALIRNDYKNTVLGHALLDPVQPPEPARETPDRGEYAALKAHLIRLNASLIHELCKLIESSPGVLAHPFFQSVVAGLDRRARDSWKSLVDVASGEGGTEPLAKALLLLRNKVAFHYDPKEVARGFRHAFDRSTGRKPYVSRGNTLRATRYFFADAAAQAYLNTRVGDDGVTKFFQDTSTLLEALNLALGQLVENFIQRRGFAWRVESGNA
jgi:hypothetical protein